MQGVRRHAAEPTGSAPRTRPGGLCAADDPRGGAPLGWLAEFVGAAGLLFTAVMATRITAPGALLGSVDQLPAGRALVIGVSVGTELGLFALTPLARCSGAHINPAVTLMLWRAHRLPARSMVVYVAAQVAGGFAGAGAAAVVLGAAVARPAVDYGLIQPDAGRSSAATAAGEFAMTVLLLAVIAAMQRQPSLRRFGPLPAAALVALMIWVGARLSGAGFNPIRNLAPAVFADRWSFEAVYLLAPLAASLCMAALIVQAPSPARSHHAEYV